MFSKIVLVISLLFFVANAAVKFSVRDGNLRKVSKSVKAKAISKIKAHLQTNKVHPDVARIGKKVAEAKKLQDWNTYDSSFNSIMWTNAFFYTESVSNNCAGSPVKQFSNFDSYCFVGTFTGSNSQTYGSARTLFTSDCSQQTVGFYASSDCSGTPAAQSNTEAGNTYDTCVAYTNDYYTSVMSAVATCTSSAADWTGEGAVEIISYEQTDTCSGSPASYTYYLGGCYATDDGGSINYASGPTLSLYSNSDCSGTADQTVTMSSCQADDDDGDDDDDDGDDNLFDDGQFTNVVTDESTSSKYEWTGASSTLVLNYYLSAALVVVFCTLSL